MRDLADDNVFGFIENRVFKMGSLLGETGQRVYIGPALAAGLGFAGGSALSSFGGGGGGGSVKTPPVILDSLRALLNLGEGPLPNVPLQGIAGATPETPETALAKETATELIQSKDIFELPEVQAIIQQVTQAGDLLANRISRSLQASGNITSTSGRDVLGRAVSDVQGTLTASLAQFAQAERDRRASLIPVLAGLGLSEEERDRILAQAELDALFQQQETEAFLPLTFQLPFLSAAAGGNVPSVVTGSQPSGFSQISGLIGPLLAALLQPGGTTGTPASILPGTGGSVGLGISPQP